MWGVVGGWGGGYGLVGGGIYIAPLEGGWGVTIHYEASRVGLPACTEQVVVDNEVKGVSSIHRGVLVGSGRMP